jgi:hypothetical protein
MLFWEQPAPELADERRHLVDHARQRGQDDGRPATL